MKQNHRPLFWLIAVVLFLWLFGVMTRASVDWGPYGKPNPFWICAMVVLCSYIVASATKAYFIRTSSGVMTRLKRISHHDTKPFDVYRPPEKYCELMRKRYGASSMSDDERRIFELGLGEYNVYVDGGFSTFYRLPGDGRRVCVAPTALCRVVGPMVLNLSDCDSFEDARAGVIPSWLHRTLVARLPGYRPHYSEVIYGNRPQDGVVYALNKSAGVMEYTYPCEYKQIDRQLRENYLESLLTKSIAEHSNLETLVRLKKSLATSPERQKTQPPQQQPPANSAPQTPQGVR